MHGYYGDAGMPNSLYNHLEKRVFCRSIGCGLSALIHKKACHYVKPKELEDM